MAANVSGLFDDDDDDDEDAGANPMFMSPAEMQEQKRLYNQFYPPAGGSGHRGAGGDFSSMAIEFRRMASSMNIGCAGSQSNLKKWKPTKDKPQLKHLLPEIARRGGKKKSSLTDEEAVAWLLKKRRLRRGS